MRSRGSRGSALLALVRRIRGIPRPAIGRDEALRLATAEMRRHGWEHDPKAPVYEDLRQWVVYARDAPYCANMAVYIDMQDGKARAYTERGLMTVQGEGPSGDPDRQ